MAKFKDDLRQLKVDEFKVKESKPAQQGADAVFFQCSTPGFNLCAPSGGIGNCQQNCSQCASCAQCQGGNACGSCGIGLTIACGNCGQCGGGGTCGQCGQCGTGGFLRGGGFRGRF